MYLIHDVSETPILLLFLSLVEQMAAVVVEAIPRGFFKKDHFIYTVINAKRNNFINKGQMSRKNFI